jgi:hypothetical protein
VNEDPIVEETREARRQLHEEFHGDKTALLEYLKQIERDNSDRVVKLKPRLAELVNRRIS